MSHPQKKQKMSDPDNQNMESLPLIFTLYIDCFYGIFEYLSVKDLHSFGETCKEMNKLAGEYFKENFSSAKNICTNDGVYTVYSDKDGVVKEQIKTYGFTHFMPRILHYDNDLGLRYMQSHISEFEATKNIILQGISINSTNIEFIRNLLPQLETVQIRDCSIEGDLYEMMLKYCKNLKKIHVRHCEIIHHQNEKYSWLSYEYPNLEYLDFIPSPYPDRVEELIEFFVQHPNVQRFSTKSDFINFSTNMFLNMNTKLDILEVNAYNFPHSSNGQNSLNILNRLHEQNFFKRLHLSAYCLSKDFITLLISFKGLESLCINSFEKSYDLPQMINLKELIILNGSNAADMEILANSLVNLERLYIKNASIDDIMPFIRRSPKLNKIKVYPRNRESFNGGVLNLTLFNKERAELARARKITIYTRDDVFLATKWATKNGDTNLNLIEIKRSDSHDWHHYDA